MGRIRGDLGKTHLRGVSYDTMSDNNFVSHWGITGLAIIDRSISPDNPTQYSDILKLSLCANTLIERCHIEGGIEDCIDAVRGTNYTIRACTLNPNGRNGITLKGALDGATVQDVVFDKHGSECDIELGQYDRYQSPPFKKTKHINIVQTKAKDNQPVKVKVWMADMPNVAAGNVKVTKVNPIFVWCYFLFRWIQIKLGGQ